MNGKSPDAFRTISEVADWLGVNAHVLRFWESKFSQVKPVKRAGGRRYYRPADMELLGGIQKLLHEDGLTIKGVQKVLREQGVRAVCALSKPIDAEAEPADQADAEPKPVAASPSPVDLREIPSHRTRTAPPSSPSVEDTPLFGHQPEAPKPAPTEEPAQEPAPHADEVPQPAETAAGNSLEVETVAPEPAEPAAPHKPQIAPLPGSELPLAEAITRLAPRQIPVEALAPIHARLLDLKARMDAAG